MQLDPDLAEWQALAATVVDYLTGVLRDLPDAPASSFDGVDELVADPALRRPPPETGRPLAELLRRARPGGRGRAQPVHARLPRLHPRQRAGQRGRWPG